jgi:hypothetical protein
MVNDMTETNGSTAPSLEKPVQSGFLGPLAILTAIVTGSAIAIEFGLVSVSVIFWLLKAESAEVASELSRLPWYCLTFMALVIASVAAMYSLMKGLTWRWRAQTAMWTLVTLIAAWFTEFR